MQSSARIHVTADEAEVTSSGDALATSPGQLSPGSRGECIHVCVRVRPISSRPNDKGSSQCVIVKGGNEVILSGSAPASPISGEPSDSTSGNGKSSTFTFDSVLDVTTKQEQLYEGTCRSIVDQFFAGYNTSILVYGQTGSGKTYTVMGTDRNTDAGIAYRVAAHVDSWLKSKAMADHDIDIVASYLEIYQEQLIDLLDASNAKKTKQAKLKIREDPVKGVFVSGLMRREVEGADDIIAVLEEGNERRHVGSTQMNDQSSRSHSVFTITVYQRLNSDVNGLGARRSELNIVDLAGSERQTATLAVGDRLKEGAKINASLSALGLVIKSLVEGNAHVPFRNSSLTRLLQSSLGGNARTLLIACISPTASCAAESLSTLKFASRAKLIQNKPKIFSDPKMLRIAQLEAEVASLEARLARCTCRHTGPEEHSARSAHCCALM